MFESFTATLIKFFNIEPEEVDPLQKTLTQIVTSYFSIKQIKNAKLTLNQLKLIVTHENLPSTADENYRFDATQLNDNEVEYAFNIAPELIALINTYIEHFSTTSCDTSPRILPKHFPKDLAECPLTLAEVFLTAQCDLYLPNAIIYANEETLASQLPRWDGWKDFPDPCNQDKKINTEYFIRINGFLALLITEKIKPAIIEYFNKEIDNRHITQDKVTATCINYILSNYGLTLLTKHQVTSENQFSMAFFLTTMELNTLNPSVQMQASQLEKEDEPTSAIRWSP